ncbi:beta-xylosidase [bacterium]|nr:MAG: beta-xylosidase [bacterium]
MSVTRGTRISVRRAKSLPELKTAPEVKVWSDTTPSRAKHIWAPEFYLIDGKWYLYYTASDDVDINHRCYVLESKSDDPMGPYEFKAQLLTDPENKLYGIDGTTVVNAKGERFFFWAGHPGHRIFVSAMSNPWTLTGTRQLIKADGFGCTEVREGPICLHRNGKIFLIYSTCDTGKPDYKLGMLSADENANLADPTVWTQFPRPVFSRCDDHGVYGPGHNSFFRSPDGDDWICYHAKTVKEFTYAGRSTRVQRFKWDENGFPDFDVPLDLQTPIEEPGL